MSSEVRFRVVKTRGGWDGTVVLPFLPGQGPPMAPSGEPAARLAVTAKGKASKTAAAKQAAGAALKVLDNPAIQAVMPPQAAIALKVLKKVPFGKLKKLF